jgi:pimeloyl-ACP methyl ester carboxylesterase
LDNPVSQECYGNQQKAIDRFREDRSGTLAKLQSSNIPILVLMGDHDIGFPVEDWYRLVGKLPSTQLIVMPQAGHGPQHQYPDLSAKYIASFIEDSKESIKYRTGL